jgi:hypothetical protein
MRCSPVYPTRWPTRPLRSGDVPTAARQAVAPAASGTNLACQLTVSVSSAGRARDCRRSDGRAAVMQVRPLLVVSGIDGSNLFVRSPFGTFGWL